MTNQLSPVAPLMCRRDDQGRILALTRQTLDQETIAMMDWQAVSADDAEVDAFVYQDSSHTEALSKTDIGLIRVLEDLIDVLINRGLIQFTDLPDAAQTKLLERRQSRANLSRRLQALLLDDDKGLF